MKIWDSELLIDKKPAEPVTDGLILWFDGQDEIGTNQKLFNRVTQSYVPINLTTSTSQRTITQSSDGKFIVIHSKVNLQTGQYWEVSAASNTQTLEYVRSGDGYQYIFGNAQTSVLYVGYYGADGYKVRYRKNGTTTLMDIVLQTAPSHIVAKNGVIYVDGVKYETPNLTTVASTFTIFNVSWSDNTSLIGAVRAYDRELSESEILQNLEYEKSIGRVVL